MELFETYAFPGIRQTSENKSVYKSFAKPLSFGGMFGVFRSILWGVRGYFGRVSNGKDKETYRIKTYYKMVRIATTLKTLSTGLETVLKRLKHP